MDIIIDGQLYQWHRDGFRNVLWELSAVSAVLVRDLGPVDKEKLQDIIRGFHSLYYIRDRSPLSIALSDLTEIIPFEFNADRRTVAGCLHSVSPPINDKQTPLTRGCGLKFKYSQMFVYTDGILYSDPYDLRFIHANIHVEPEFDGFSPKHLFQLRNIHYLSQITLWHDAPEGKIVLDRVDLSTLSNQERQVDLIIELRWAIFFRMTLLQRLLL